MTIRNKYDKREIMLNAWRRYRKASNYVTPLAFATCLRYAWADAKRENRTFAGYVNISSPDGSIEVTTLTGVVTGKTYGWRKTLKAYGATWCSDERYWALPLDRVQEFCRNYA